MAPKKTTTPQDKTPATPSPQVDDNKALREDWGKMSKDEQDKFINSLSLADQTEFGSRLGWYNHKGVSVSAPTAWNSIKTEGMPFAVKAPSTAWMKEKAYSLLNWSANQLPTVGGVAGGMGGGAAGEAIDPAGGGVPGSIVGSGIGGGIGEGARQGVNHLSGMDKYDESTPKTWGARFKEMAKEGAGQAAAEATGQLFGKLLRPTLQRSLAKLYYSGNLKYGNPLGPGDLEHVVNDLIATEKAGGKATTVGDFLGVINQTKKEIGQEVDLQMALPIRQNGQMTMLGKAHADTTPVANAISSLLSSDPSVVKMAQLNPAGKEAVYLDKVRREALNFSKTPWTYQELTDRRIKLNNELAPLYTLPPGEQRVYLLDHPELAFKKAEADAIRGVIYPEMDRLSGHPMGTTELLQSKRGALVSLENQVNEHLGTLKTKIRQAQGAPVWEKTNVSTYGTSSGKPGFALHRLQGLVHTPNPERAADRQVAKAFGNTVGSKVRGVVSTPLGSKALGNEILSMPLREIVNPAQPQKPEDKDSSETPGPQSSVATPSELKAKAKQLNPAAQGQTAFAHTAVNPQTGHRIGSRDGIYWVDFQTGAKVA